MSLKCLLLSASYENRKVVLKFYHPESNRLILWSDNTNHKPFCYVDPEIADSLKELKGIESLTNVELTDVLKDKPRNMVRVEVSDPLVIGGKQDSLREKFKTYESDIKYYLTYIYDKSFNIGRWYNVSDKIEAIKSPERIEIKADLAGIIDKDLFKTYLEYWAKLLAEPIPKLRRLAFDIEVETSKGLMPDPGTASERVTAIGFESEDFHECFVLNRFDNKTEGMGYFNTTCFDSEKEMIEKAFEIIESYPICLTYNGDVFDMPYLYNRAINLGIEHIPLKMMTKNATLAMGIHIDMYGVFSDRSLKIYAFKNKYVEDSLDSVSSALLGEKKVEYQGELHQIPLSTLARYCYNDARLTYRLSSYNNDMVINLLVILARIGNMPIDDISRVAISNWIKSLLYFTHRQNSELIPRSDDFPQVEASTKADIDGKKYQGAIVLSPTPGIHFDVKVMDFASLYPSIIKTKNISYETVRCTHPECQSNKIPQTNHWACTKRTGIVSLLIGALKELRVNHFKKLSKSSEQKEIYETISESIKVFLNASYGVIGFESFPLYFLPTAEAVTAYGREIISQTVQTARELGMNVIYGDTDSMFIKQPTQEQIASLITFASKTFNIDLEQDKTYRYVVLSNRRKNYFGIKADGTADIKGLTGKKSNTPPFVRTIFARIIKELGGVKDYTSFDSTKKWIYNNIRETIQGFDSIPLEQLAFKVLINKEPSEYKVKPQAVRAAEMLGSVKKGMFIQFVKIWKDDGIKPIQLVARNEIDKPKYIETMGNTLAQILEPMQIDFDSIATGYKKTKIDEFW